MQDHELEKQADLFCMRPCLFVKGVASLDALPMPEKTEIAFAGRSNVGKSSLINAVFRKKDLARASATPGRTQQLNYFDLDNKMYIVDMPGYGYAKASDKQVKEWNNLVFTYLKGRPNLRRVFLLIDSRHGIKDKDTEVMKMLDKAAVSYQLILTKTDKLNAASLEKITADVKKKMTSFIACHPQLLITSAEKKQGLTDVRISLYELLEN